ncbi:MAG: 4Fe-4S binding protein [Candidatus Poribacteria bacterium]|nr:4Fe-4S binding protein [Candidatus Poribacteria bacterium]
MIHVDYDACDYCGACVGTCPEVVIHLLDAKLIVDNKGCTDCGICTYACPVEALALDKLVPGGAAKQGGRREVVV